MSCGARLTRFFLKAVVSGLQAAGVEWQVPTLTAGRIDAVGRPVARAQVSELGGDPLTQRAADALARRERAGRLGSALVALGGDLAGAHRQIALLRRENVALRAQLARLAGDPEHRSAARRGGAVGNGDGARR